MTGGQQYFVKLILPLSAPVDILEHMFDNIVPTDSPVASGVDLSALHAFIDELAQSDQRAGTLDGDIAVALEVAIRRLQSVQAQAADRFNTSGAFAADGARRAHSWLTHRSNTTRGQVGVMLRAGVWQRRHPLMGAALAAGHISIAHLRALDRTHARFPRLQPVLIEAEESIAELARSTDVRRFEQLLFALCHRADPDAVDADERKHNKHCYLFATTVLDGQVRLDALLPADIGQQFLATLESARRAVVADVAADGCHDPGPVDEEGQRLSHRNIQALHRILNAAAAATEESYLPAINASRPVIHVSIPIESLLDDTAGHTAGLLRRFGMPAEVTTTITSSTHVKRLACDGIINPFIIDSRGRLVASLPSVRSVPIHLRKAVHVRDLHCRFPGCPSRIDEAHHIIFARNDGPTSMNNLIGLCWYHHQHIHHGPWEIAGDANYTVTFLNTHSGISWRVSPPPQPRNHAPLIN